MTLIRCPKCGEQFGDNEKFCGNCGTSLNSDLSKFISANKRSLLYKKLVDSNLYTAQKINEEDIANIDDVYMQTDYVDGQNVKQFYYINKEHLSLEEVKIELMLKQQKELETIKTILLFFAILTIIGLLFTCYEVYQYIHILESL